ncbi:MAG: TonB-dependent receptor, partial [Bacteroidia bacterium]
MKNITCITMLILALVPEIMFSASLPDRGSLSGKITDKQSGEPVPGATVYLPDLKKGCISQADGTYLLNDLPKIKTLVQVKVLGYATLVKLVDLNTSSILDLQLEEAVIESEEVVITGTSHATEIKRNPVPMVSIDQKYITEGSSTNIIDALVKVPGISALSTGPNISKPYIRGLGYNRILTLFDGLRQDGQQWGDEHGIEVDQYLVDRIEVVKGPASLVYGSDALAGVVNLLPAHPAPEGMIQGSATMNYQTNNKQEAGSFALSSNHQGFIWGLRASHKQASNYQNKVDGRVFGTKYRENDANLFSGVNRSWGYSHLNFTLYDNLQEIPDGSRDSSTRKFTRQVSEEDTLRPLATNAELNSYTIGVIHQHVQHYRVYSDNNFILGKSRLGLKLGAQQSVRREFGHPAYPDLPALFLTLNTYTYDIKYYLPELNGWQSSIGMNGMYQQNKNSGATEFVIPAYHSLDGGPFVFSKRTFGKLDVAAGARYDIRSFRSDALYTAPDPTTGFYKEVTFNASDSSQLKQFDAYSHTFAGFSGSIGCTYNFNKKFSLKLNCARGYRAPNIAEISAKGVHPGTGFEQLGDPNFKPEFNIQEDAGLFFTTEHITGSIELFNNNIGNYIYNEKLQSVSGGDSIFVQDGNTYPVFKFRQTKAQLYGGEFSFDIHPHPLDWLHFENTASVILAENRGGNGAIINDSTRFLPYIPPFHTNSELRAD